MENFKQMLIELQNSSDPNVLQKISEAYLEHKFHQQNKNDKKLSKDDIKKYLFLGWYVYQQLNDNVPECDLD